MSVAAYVRVSSRSQNYATQREAISRAAKARGDVIRHWFEEKKSAKNLDRPVLTHVRDLARRGEVRRLYVFRLDRLARSGMRDLLTVVEELRAAGCSLQTIADGFDLEGPAADVVVAVLGWAAEMERVALGERISAARARIEAAGGSWGRPRRIGGKQAREIVARNKKGESIREIAIAMKIPRSTVGAAARASRKPTPGSAPKAPSKKRRKRAAAR
jgi:DNA invertase Pin-like site-specific DNA recombinase